MEILYLICQYLRMVSYAVIVITAFRNIANRKFTSLLFLGDIVVALALLFASMYAKLFDNNRELLEICILTPSMLFWAGVHFYTLVFSDNLKEGTK